MLKLASMARRLTDLGRGRRGRARTPRVGRERAERLTVGLALLALATAGSVLVAESARLARRRRAARAMAEAEPAPIQAMEVIQAAGQATQDTVTVAIEGYSGASRQETVLFNLLTGFVFSFAFARVSTRGMRSGWWPLGTISIGGRHIHHFVPGILLAFGSGIAALLIDDLDAETKLALPFGIGLGLTFDEAALLLDLRDVYWSREGLLSVQMSLGTASVLGGTILALRMIRRGEQRGESQGLIPDAEGQILVPTPAAATL